MMLIRMKNSVGNILEYDVIEQRKRDCLLDLELDLVGLEGLGMKSAI